MVAGLIIGAPLPARAACASNVIACENALPGTPQSVWDVDGTGDRTIQGFATQTSVNAGSSIAFKIDTNARAYTIKIYRLGYYQGNGAREIATINPSAALPQTQPACATSTATEIYDCGTWGVSASWSVPVGSVSGVYIARLIRTDTGGDSHIPFVVRNDGNTTDVVMQTSDSTWQAYNDYGGSEFYHGKANGRAYKISYNRPYNTRGTVSGRDYLFANEYPMIRYLEQNGYDVSYVSGLDVSVDSALLRKHKVFLSVGHDEYWTKDQRKNVTDARDAGVNLGFFGGNDVYWKTRMEPSQDGTNTANRTVVDYKDTWAGTQLDPIEPTATWRDPRFGDLGYGYGPENALTGTLYQANSVDLAIKVNANEGKYRLWRDTTLSTMTAGSTATLSDHTVGYESNEDLDNGYRPDGLVDLSTTVGPTPEYLTDYGNSVSPGTTTHHVTLYRVPSGALVFSAGSIQWSWGLDPNHDGVATPADPRMRQATTNLLADMGALASTIAPDLTAATKSTDSTPPTTSVSAPAAGSTIAQGSLVTVTGTSSDVGGKVAGVEVSVDGGATFHPADGRESWTYAGILTGNGVGAIQVRSTDDSGRTQTPVNLNINSPCPCSIFGVANPTLPDGNDGSSVTLGVRFTSAADGFITGVRFYKAAANTGTHNGTLYSSTGSVLATGTFTGETASGWQQLTFADSVPITAGTTYVAAYTAPNGHYPADQTYFARAHNARILTALGGRGVANGVYASGSGFPSSTYMQSNYYVDATYSATDTSPVTVTSTSPSAGATSVATTTLAAATFSKSVLESSVSLHVLDPAGNDIPGTVVYNPTTRKATFNPAQGLANNTTYTATVNAQGMGAPVQWTFTTVAADGTPNVCPCTLFNESDQPAAGPDPDTVQVQLGMAFKASSAGVISGIRFYKNLDNQGPHTVALWSSSGTKLAEATVANETTSGWQFANFDAGVSIASGSTYVASYTAPQGRYGYTSSGLANVVTKGPLSSIASGGRYTYGSGALTSTSSANYFVDPVFNPTAATAPTVRLVSPGNLATSVPVNDHVQVTFSTDIQPGSAVITLKRTADGSDVAGTTSGESQGSAATFVSSSDLDPGTSYTVLVTGARNLSGTQMTSTYTSKFTTSGAAACPCSLLETTTEPVQSDSGDGGAVTVGLKFTSSVNGFVKGLRYYRDSTNTGTHTGSLYDASGTKLAGLTFTDGPAGWQTANFTSSVAVTAGSTYVAAYYAPNGHYAADLNYFNNPVVNTPLSSVGTGSVYSYSNGFPNQSYQNSNYYVDVIFTTSDDDPPNVTTVTPAAAATAVPTSTAVTATFDRPITESSLSLTLTDPAGQLVGGQLAYDAAAKKATFTTAAALVGGASYTASAQASSASGVAMAAPKTWAFTTADSTPPTVTSTTPANGATGQPAATKPTALFDKPVTAGTVVMTLKTAAGTAVGGTTAYNATTRVSTFTPTAALASLTDYNVTATATSTSGVAMTAPKAWTFTTADTAAPVVSARTPAPGATGVAANTTVTATFAKPITASTLVMGLKTAAGATVSGTSSYDATSQTATFIPTSALISSTGYTASVRASSAAGVAMAAATTWSFTTVAQTFSLFTTGQAPTTGPSATTTPITVGVRFSSSRAGKVTAIRYYADSTNTGTTVGLWSSTGTRLGTATTSGTGTGWRTATFATPINITSGTAYVASYYAPVGRYSNTATTFGSAYSSGPLTVPTSGGRSVSGNAFPTTSTTANLWVDVVVLI